MLGGWVGEHYWSGVKGLHDVEILRCTILPQALQNLQERSSLETTKVIGGCIRKTNREVGRENCWQAIIQVHRAHYKTSVVLGLGNCCCELQGFGKCGDALCLD